jgi:hypothetical protein
MGGITDKVILGVEGRFYAVEEVIKCLGEFI